MGGRLTFFGLAQRSFALWFGGIWLLCGVPILIAGILVAIDTHRQQHRFQTEAQVAHGMVLTKRITSSNDNTSYWVGYRFRAADGTVVKSETTVSSDVWERLVEREPVQVSYLPGQPRSNRLEGDGPDWIRPVVLMLAGLVVGPFGGWIFLRGLRGILLELRLQSAGALAEATVVDVGPASVSVNGVPQWRIRYRYQDHRGRARNGESGHMAPEDAQAWKAGDTGTARFDPRAPKQSVWIGKP